MRRSNSFRHSPDSGRRASSGQRINGLFNHCQGKAEPLSNFDDGNATEHVATVAALITGAAPAPDQTFGFVEVDSRDGDATSQGNLAS